MPNTPEIFPKDEHNTTLLENVHPADWVNPDPADRYHLVVVGGGPAGLVVASGAAGLGARVALVEKGLLGGDCLNVGCVPSKALIRSSRVLAEMREAEGLGMDVPEIEPAQFTAAMERLRRLRAQISDHDSAARFRDKGIDIFLGEGGFTGPNTFEIDGKTLRFRKAAICTGGRPSDPIILGIHSAGFVTNETVFNLTERPDRLVVVGGGPIGCELAQSFARFGSKVTIIEKYDHFLAREDPDAAQILADSFARDGIDIRLKTQVERVEESHDAKRVHIETEGRKEAIPADQILVAVGRSPNVEQIDLEAAKVRYDLKQGILVNDRLQTSNPNIYAAGDVCMRHKFTHSADAAARILIQNALFMGRKKLSALNVPWCTYTDPEIAHVGLYERDAEKQGVGVDTFLTPFSDLDRAICDGETEGFVRIHVEKGKGKILGATIVARHAGDMIGEICVAMAAGLGLGALGGVIHPYPTQAESIKHTGDAYNRTRLTPTVAKLLKGWLSWRR